MFIEKAHKKFGVLLILRAPDFADTGERAERARVRFAPEHHHLIRDNVHGDVL